MKQLPGLLEDLVQDIRLAGRALRRAPTYSAAAVLTLALGLGATTAVTAIVDHIVLRPLAYADAGRLILLREVIREISNIYPTLPANASHFLEWQRQCEACEEMAAIHPADLTLSGIGDPQRLHAVRISANLFSLLGVKLVLGRSFRAEEDQPGRDRVVVLSDAFWRRQFGADPSIINRTITLDDAPFIVIGVLPRQFRLPKGTGLGSLLAFPRDLDVFKPLALTPPEKASPGTFEYAVIARLKPDATVATAVAQLDAIQSRLAEQAPDKMTLRASVIPLEDQVVGAARTPLLLLLSAVFAVLLIVCVNLASLSLARNAGRLRESAVRIILGAGRGRLVRHAVTESVVLSLMGGLLGMLLAYWGLHALIAAAPATLPRVDEVGLDLRVLGIASLVSAGVGLTFGILPALRAGRADPGECLRAGGRTATGGRSERRRGALFIGAQASLITVLLVVTGLLLASFLRVLRVDKGFAVDRIIALDVALPSGNYHTADRRVQFYERAMHELSSLPTVQAVAVTTAIPLEGESQVDALSLEHDPRPDMERPLANIRYVSPDYFGTIGTPVRRGRSFSETDRGRNVAVLSERAAQALWPGEDPIGKRVVPGSNDPPAEVLGLVADVRTSGLEHEGSLVAYLPYWRLGPVLATILVRTSSDPGSMTSSARAAISAADLAVPITNVRTMSQVVSAALAGRRFQLLLLSVFALTALATAGVGTYGVISYSLAQRSGEIGVRMALGARPGDVRRLVLLEGLTPVALGLALGIAVSLVIGRTLGSLFFGVHPDDPFVIGGVATVLGLVAAVACYIPARRATAADLTAMLRLE